MFWLLGFSIAGDRTHGGTKIAVSGHAFFKDFTVKDGNIVENHGCRDEMSSEVKVHQVSWIADSGKTLPRKYAFKIKMRNGEETGQTTETCREIDGVWLPTRYRMIRNDRSMPIESTLRLENIKVEQGAHLSPRCSSSRRWSTLSARNRPPKRLALEQPRTSYSTNLPFRVLMS